MSNFLRLILKPKYNYDFPIAYVFPKWIDGFFSIVESCINSFKISASPK